MTGSIVLIYMENRGAMRSERKLYDLSTVLLGGYRPVCTFTVIIRFFIHQTETRDAFECESRVPVRCYD